MGHRRTMGICSLLALALPFSSLDAQESDLGGARTRLSIRAGAFYTDNFYNSPTAQTDTIGGVIAPELKLLAQTRKIEFSSALAAEYGVFDLPGSEDDYLDGSAEIGLGVQATARNRLRAAGNFKAGHDAFGTDRTEDATVRDTETDKWNRVGGSLHYRYGAAGALVNAEVGVSAYAKEYTTNRPATEVLDFDATTAEYAVFYNYSPKTSALLDFSRTDFTFDQPILGVDTRGGQLYRARIGMRWLATAKTSGDVRLGYRRRVFDVGTDDIEGADWEAGVDWAPVPRTTLRLQTAFSEQQSYTATARVISIESVALDWKYNLTARTRSGLKLEHLRAAFEGSARNDEISSGTLSLEHLALSYLWVVGNIGTTVRDSSVDAREYDRLSAFVGVRLGR